MLINKRKAIYHIGICIRFCWPSSWSCSVLWSWIWIKGVYLPISIGMTSLVLGPGVFHQRFASSPKYYLEICVLQKSCSHENCKPKLCTCTQRHTYAFAWNSHHKSGFPQTSLEKFQWFFNDISKRKSQISIIIVNVTKRKNTGPHITHGLLTHLMTTVGCF